MFREIIYLQLTRIQDSGQRFGASIRYERKAFQFGRQHSVVQENRDTQWQE